MLTVEFATTTFYLLFIFLFVFVNLSINGKYEGGTVMDRLIAFGLCRVWKASVILRW